MCKNRFEAAKEGQVLADKKTTMWDCAKPAKNSKVASQIPNKLRKGASVD